MKLLKGINVLPNIDIESIEINRGSVHHSAMEFAELDFPFRDNAFIPKSDWRKLDEHEKDLIISDQYQHSDYLSIGKLPENLTDLIKSFDIHSLHEREVVFERLKENSEILELFNEKLNSFVEDLCPNTDTLEFHRLSVIPSGRYVTSINLNMDDFEYIGLHIDHSTVFNIESAHASRNRMCINIGNEDRYLFVINLTLLQIKEMLSQVMDSNTLNVENISDCFFKYFPDYPVLKIRQRPFEYYIAPTDNCIHDGSTFENNYLDITATFLGNFEVNK